MPEYELAFIVRPNISDDEGVTGVVDQISQYVQTADGEVTSVDVWGRRQLAYPINDHREGTYVLLRTKMPSSAPAEIERNLKLSEDIIRYLLIKVDS